MAAGWSFTLDTRSIYLILHPEIRLVRHRLTSSHTLIIFFLVQFVIHLFERYALSMGRREWLNHYSLKPQESYSYEYERRRGPG